MNHGKYMMAAFALAVGVIGGLLTSVTYIGLSEGLNIQAQVLNTTIGTGYNTLFDLDRDGKITNADVIIIANTIQSSSNLTYLAVADVNRDGKVDVYDLSSIRYYMSRVTALSGVVYFDLNLDGKVDNADASVVSSLLQTSTNPGYKGLGDLTRDGRVDSQDVFYINQYLSLNPPPTTAVAISTISSATTPPPAPTDVTAVKGCGTTPRVIVNWNAVVGATSYKLFKNGSEIRSGMTDTSHIDVSVSTGQTLNYFVKATNGAGDSAPSASVSSSVALIGSCVDPVLSAMSGSCGNKVDLSWTSGTLTGHKVAYYAVYDTKKTPSLSLSDALYSGLTLGATVTMPQPGTNYSFRVVAYNYDASPVSRGGNEVSALSSVKCDGQVFDYAINTGGNIVVTKRSTGSVNGSVDIAKNISSGTSQNVRLSLSVLPSGVTLSSISNNPSGLPGNSVITLSVASSTVPGTYPLTVTAVASGWLVKTKSLSLTVNPPSTILPATTAPAIPTGVTASSVCGPTTKVTVRWNSVSGATSYKIFKNGSATALVTGVTSTTYVDTTASVGYTPRYIVKATNNVGDSLGSSTATSNTVQGVCTSTSIAPTATTPTISSVITNPSSTKVTYTINGTNLSGASFIRVYRETGALLTVQYVVSSVTSTSLLFTPDSSLTIAHTPGNYQIVVVTPFGASNKANISLIAPK